MPEFKQYTSRFATGFNTDYRPNNLDTRTVMIAVPIYQTIEAIKNTDFSKNTLKNLIESKTADLSGIYQADHSQYIDYPITCVFQSSDFNMQYKITINPSDYLVWDEEIHRFLVLTESQFLLMYK